uniref:Uncharacterized protein n=1 Tax=Setaria digitata TaxID=48799 RepID=A0A915PRD6_9BILA
MHAKSSKASGDVPQNLSDWNDNLTEWKRLLDGLSVILVNRALKAIFDIIAKRKQLK